MNYGFNKCQCNSLWYENCRVTSSFYVCSVVNCYLLKLYPYCHLESEWPDFDWTIRDKKPWNDDPKAMMTSRWHDDNSKIG